jgi:hypothetical protein
MRSEYILLPVPTQEYYVDSDSGDDANNGSISSPCKTLNGIRDRLLALGGSVSSSIRINLKSTDTPYTGSSVDLSSNTNRSVIVEPYIIEAGDGGRATIDSTSGTTFNSPRYEGDSLYLLRLTINCHPTIIGIGGYTRSRLYLIECETNDGYITTGNKYEFSFCPRFYNCKVSGQARQCYFESCLISGNKAYEAYAVVNCVILGSVGISGNDNTISSIQRNIFISQSANDAAILNVYRPGISYFKYNICLNYSSYLLPELYYTSSQYGHNWLWNCPNPYRPTGAGFIDTFDDIILTKHPLSGLNNGDYRYEIPEEEVRFAGFIPNFGPSIQTFYKSSTSHPLTF